MEIQEIKAAELNTEKFIEEKITEISEAVGENSAIVALSGGVDSSTTTKLGYKALGERLKAYFIDNGLMREGEPEKVVSIFQEMGISVEIIDSKAEFFQALRGITDPEAKRKTILKTFYQDVFGRLVRESGTKYLLQGTNFTDIEETVAGIKTQHNVLEQMGIDPQKVFGYQIIEPLRQLRKDGVRKVAEAIGLPELIVNRMPFPGPALAARVIGEVTPERVEIVRRATAMTEEGLKDLKPFQCMAILHQDRVTGIKNNQRKLGLQIEIRCWKSTDATTAVPSWLSGYRIEKLAERITAEIPEVVSVTYNVTPKPPSTMEAI